MIKIRHILYILSSLCLGLFLTGCKAVVLDPKGVIAVHEKHLLITALILMLVIVVPVIILVFVIARRYRASNDKAKYAPEFTHSAALEFVWWVVPCVIILILGIITWITTHALDPYKPLDGKAIGAKHKPITIQVVALEWKWLFIYPQQHIATLNYVEFPAKTPVNFYITSDAPMNSFQIPQLGGQIYAMNGMQTKLHLMANEIGDYRGGSVSFSGDGFAAMRFIARASSMSDFNKWVQEVKQSKNTLSMAAYQQLVKPSVNHFDVPASLFSRGKGDRRLTASQYANLVKPLPGNSVVFYASVEPDLYHKVIAKFIAPHDRHRIDVKPEAVKLFS